MKKYYLILGLIFLFVLSINSQNGSKCVGFHNAIKSISNKYAAETVAFNPILSQTIGPIVNPNPIEAEQSAVMMPPSTINWKLIGGTNNIYGNLESSSRPLQYNANVNAVSFVHRKSATYAGLPTNNSGNIVAQISTNWGSTWDSTCIWSSGTDLGCYPQGAIHSAPGNTNIANAYIVGSGPTTDGSAWTGDWYGSKQLGTYNNLASAAPNAQQLLSITAATYSPTQGKHGWSRQGFSSTNDGVVRSLALIQDDQQGLSTMRGMSVVKGTFNAGVFTWTTDSIIPSTIVKSTGEKVINPAPQMAWNQAGTIGYVVALGAKAGATNSNKGYQPLVYKTTNGGLTWASIPGIDFNSSSATALKSHIAGVNTNSNLAIPFFSDFNLAVDVNDKLHIGATFKSTYSNHDDSLMYVQNFSMSIDPGSNYNWEHRPGKRPYLIDFIGDGNSSWGYFTIDSMFTEAAGSFTNEAGYSDNPWDPSLANGEKSDNMDSRIQLARTPDGRYITFSWSESDTNFTNGSRKYNSLPNIKARCMAIGSGTNMYQVSPTEINVSKVAAGTGTNNPNVASRATLNYMSPTTGAATTFTATNSYTVDINTPITVTNSNPFSQATNNSIWYQSGKLSYVFPALNCCFDPFPIIGINEEMQNNSIKSVIFPNPASNNVTLSIDLKDNSKIDISVVNAIGQALQNNKFIGHVGENNIAIDLSGLSNGIYFVTIRVGDVVNTKKIVVQ